MNAAGWWPSHNWIGFAFSSRANSIDPHVWPRGWNRATPHRPIAQRRYHAGWLARCPRQGGKVLTGRNEPAARPIVFFHAAATMNSAYASREGRAALDPIAGRESSLQDYLRVIRRNRWLVVTAVLVVPLAAIALSLAQPARYAATARVLLNTQNLSTSPGATPGSSGRRRTRRGSPRRRPSWPASRPSPARHCTTPRTPPGSACSGSWPSRRYLPIPTRICSRLRSSRRRRPPLRAWRRRMRVRSPPTGARSTRLLWNRRERAFSGGSRSSHEPATGSRRWPRALSEKTGNCNHRRRCRRPMRRSSRPPRRQSRCSR